jgi:hypothetical protein
MVFVTAFFLLGGGGGGQIVRQFRFNKFKKVIIKLIYFKLSERVVKFLVASGGVYVCTSHDFVECSRSVNTV